jgi:acyl-coenzyme A synthetase/AMP-(fatty) acid ligase
MVTPDLWRDIQRNRYDLGLRNVILLHSKLGGPCVGPAELVFDEFNYHALKTMDGTVFMNDLIPEYSETEISYGSDDAERIAIITHTSGTTKGTRKPLPYTNRAINSTAMAHRTAFGSRGHHLRIAPSFDFSSFLNMNLVNGAFTAGDIVVLTFFGFLHPKFVRAVDYYKLDILFTSGFMFDKWLERQDTDDINFASLRILACGGSYLSPEKLKKYSEFAKDHGYRFSIIRGYGMSETGSAQLEIPANCDADIIGYPKPKENFRIQDENDQNFYTADDGVRTGTMYIASDSTCLNELDGETLFEYTQIDGRNFICTNDLVRVNEDGSFSYAGRADRYFVNNEGVRFDPGIVEVKISAMPEVDRCAVVPILDKRIHDTVPVLYVIPSNKGPGAEECIRKALARAFIIEGSIADTNLPTQFVIVDDIPCNSNGKIDIYRITRDRLNGQAYNIVPVKNDDKLTDIRIELATHLDSIRAGTLPDGMGESSALGIFDLFNSPSSGSIPTMQPNPFMYAPFKKNKKGNKGKDNKKMPEMPPEFMQFSMKLQGKFYGKKEIEQFIESDARNTF